MTNRLFEAVQIMKTWIEPGRGDGTALENVMFSRAVALTSLTISGDRPLINVEEKSGRMNGLSIKIMIVVKTRIVLRIHVFQDHNYGYHRLAGCVFP